MLDRHLAQVRLLVSVLPAIARETGFAVKGGTAIGGGMVVRTSRFCERQTKGGQSKSSVVYSDEWALK